MSHFQDLDEKPENEPAKTAPPFEEARQRLEDLIEALEDGKVPLAEMVEKHEEANKLLEVCQSQLQDAQLRVEQLGKKTGERESSSIPETESP